MIIEHGSWSLSAPQQHIMHTHRDDTGMDWYEFVKTKPFGDGSVVMTVGAIDVTGVLVVQAATKDPTAIFPAGMRVIEETEYVGGNPFGDYHGHVYDISSSSIGDMYAPPPPPPTAFEVEILNRLAALEANAGS
jgi:hypothetical protein